MIDRFGFGPHSHVIELASNDGYLLQWFVKAGVPSLGIEPAANVAAAAEEKGVPHLVRFFGVELAEELAAEGRPADLLLGNNVLAQVPDLNDFVAGMKIVLAPDGRAHDGVPPRPAPDRREPVRHHLPRALRLLLGPHHPGRSSLTTASSCSTSRRSRRTAARSGLRPPRGGRHASPSAARSASCSAREEGFGLTAIDRYRTLRRPGRGDQARHPRAPDRAEAQGKRIAGYGAPGKGNTLLNYCGIRTDFLDFTVDRNTYKQGLFLPGTHIPILAPEEIERRRPGLRVHPALELQGRDHGPDGGIREWGGRFIVPIPKAHVVP